MQNLTFWTGYLIAVFLINISPGPEMIFVISSTMSKGKKQGFFSALGAATGSTVHVILVAFGLAIILSTSLMLFAIIKIVGAIYLVYLGIKAIISKNNSLVISNDGQNISDKSFLSYYKGVLVGVLNPKSAIFFLAFLPQFVRPENGSFSFQIICLGVITVIAGILIELVIIFIVNKTVHFLSQKQIILDIIDKLMGSILICLGIRLALSSQKD